MENEMDNYIDTKDNIRGFEVHFELDLTVLEETLHNHTIYIF